MSKQVTLMTDAIPYQEFAKLIGKSTGAVRRMIDTAIHRKAGRSPRRKAAPVAVRAANYVDVITNRKPLSRGAFFVDVVNVWT